jgi:hypothetical protein
MRSTIPGKPFPPIWRTLALVCAWLVLAACQPQVTPVAQADPLILTLQMTPALDRLRPAMHTCAEEEGLGLAITTLPAPALDPLATGLALRWGAPAQTDMFAAVLAEEALVFIVHPNNPLKSLSAADLRGLYTGQRTAWPGAAGGEVHAWAYPAGDDVQQAFESALFDTPPQTALPVFLAPDPAAMLEAVAQYENAIGFVPAGWVNDSLPILTVSGIEAHLLRQPLLALSPAEPQQPARGWLLCLQEQLSPK